MATRRRRKLPPPSPNPHAKLAAPARRGVALFGVWAFRGEPPEIKFKITPNKEGKLNVKLSLPKKELTLPEGVWRAFFRFLASTLHTIRPASVDEKLKEYIKAERERRRRRYRRYRRHRHGIVAVSKKKPKAPPSVDLTNPTNPSSELVKIAEEALEASKKDSKKGAKKP